MNKVVVRLIDGNLIKGVTTDFFPGKDVFHVSVANAPAGTKPVEINIRNMKAVFFVKDLTGNPQHVKQNEFDPKHPPVGRRIKVVFKDGEVLVGTTVGYHPERSGFFVVPADADSNNDRCYVITAATQDISFI
ncbi:MAG TPA: hypothetical protein VIS94_11155 [Desulfomonilia bacterium]|jgi:hypothetical protein